MLTTQRFEAIGLTPSQHHVSLAKPLKLVCLVFVWLGSVENTTPNAFETSGSGISVAWNCWKHHWFQRFLVGWLMSWGRVTLFHFKSCAFIRSKPHYCQTHWFQMFLIFNFLHPPDVFLVQPFLKPFLEPWAPFELEAINFKSWLSFLKIRKSRMAEMVNFLNPF